VHSADFMPQHYTRFEMLRPKLEGAAVDETQAPRQDALKLITGECSAPSPTTTTKLSLLHILTTTSFR
jgi:hypothetical protein